MAVALMDSSHLSLFPRDPLQFCVCSFDSFLQDKHLSYACEKFSVCYSYFAALAWWIFRPRKNIWPPLQNPTICRRPIPENPPPRGIFKKKPIPPPSRRLGLPLPPPRAEKNKKRLAKKGAVETGVKSGPKKAHKP